MTILIVGLGSIAKKHILAIQLLEPDAVIYALRSTLSALPIEGIKNIYSLAELAGIKLDFAILSNPTAQHKASIEQLLDCHCPLFIEKPLFHSLDIELLVAKVVEAGVLTYVACNLRFLNCLEFIQKELSDTSKRINEVNAYCGSYLPDWRSNVDFRSVYSAIPSLGGGVHLDLIHELDYLYWLFGMPKKVHTVLRHTSDLQIESYDYANYSLEYTDFCASVILNYYRKDTKRVFELLFEDGTWLVDLIANKVVSNSKVLFASNETIQDTYLKQMGYFLQLVKNKESKSCNTIVDAFNVLKICLENDAEK